MPAGPIPPGSGTAAVLCGHTPVLPDLPFGEPGPKDLGKPFISIVPTQIVGLVEIKLCDEVECRVFKEVCKDCNIVFGEVGTQVPTYENDFSAFLFDYTLKLAILSADLVFKLQKFFEGEWRDYPFGLNLNSNANGIFYPMGSFPTHPTYTGYAINWGQVMQNAGRGIYRFVAVSTFGGNEIASCSPPFDLRPWNCNIAKGTVKFESWLTGKVGDKRKDYVIYDLCGINWYDSIRIKGWFGYYKVPEYKEILLEWGQPHHGKIERVRDEAVQRFEYLSKYLPFYIHERFSVYAMMADELRVSDYNFNNSDYTLKRLIIVKDGAYEPEYIDDKGQRRSKVKVQFKRGVQGVIKSLCCPVINRT